MDWNDLKYLLALKRAGTVAAAARSLRVDHSTVSRRLTALEEELGTQLFRRTPEGLVFTSEGEAAASSAEVMERATAELRTSLAGTDDRPQGRVHLTIPESFLPPVLAAVAPLGAAHPGLEVELSSSSAALDLLRGEADLALRLFRPPQQGLVARRVGEIGWSLYASAAYLARRGPVSNPLDLGGHELMGFEADLKGTPGQRWLDQRDRGARVAMRGATVQGVALAISQGAGLGVLPCFLGDREPALRRASPDVVAVGEAYLVTTPALARTRRVRLVIEALAELFARERGTFAGTGSAPCA